MRTGCWAIGVLALWPTAAGAGEVVEEVVSEPFPGIEITERTEADPNNRIRIARVSLCEAQVHVTATAPATSFTTPGSWAGSSGVQLATNGDFFTSGPQVYGDAVGGGMPWPLGQTGKSASGSGTTRGTGGSRSGPTGSSSTIPSEPSSTTRRGSRPISAGVPPRSPRTCRTARWRWSVAFPSS